VADRPGNPVFRYSLALLHRRLLHLRRQLLVLCCRHLPYPAETNISCLSRRPPCRVEAVAFRKRYCFLHSVRYYGVYGRLYLVQDAHRQEGTFGRTGTEKGEDGFNESKSGAYKGWGIGEEWGC